MQDHYELQCAQWAEKIASLSASQVKKKLPELHLKGNNASLRHFDRVIEISWDTGNLRCISDSEPLNLNERLNVYTLLWYCKENANLSGNWLPFHSMKHASPYAPAFAQTVLHSFSHCFDGKESLLKEAVQRIGGIPLGDHHYFVLAFACMPLLLQFWDGDEEFPAQGNILFDQNATDFIHVESLVTIASQCVYRLRSLANL